MPQENWQQNFVVTAGTKGKLNGRDVTYYPVSPRLLFQLKQYAAPISLLVASLFAEKNQAKTDVGSVTRNVAEFSEGKGLSEFITQPISSELAETRQRLRATAVQHTIDTVLGDESVKLLCQIVINSLREIFPRSDKSNPSPEELADTIDTPVLLEALGYVAQANAGMFGPLMEAAGINAQTLAAKIKEFTATKPAIKAAAAATEL